MEKEIFIAPSMCDSGGRLGVSGAFALFMDAASEDAENIGAGETEMSGRGLFWLTVQTCVRFYERPEMVSRAVVSTWAGKPEHAYVNRYYTLSAGGRLLAEGKTKWAVLDRKSGGIVVLKGGFFDSLPYSDKTACGGGRVRIGEDFSGASHVGSAAVRSTDIDLGGHMNNAAYLRALEGAFPTRELRAVRIDEVDACFRRPCFEGETLELLRRDIGGGAEFGMLKSGGEAAFLARVLFTRL